MTHVRRNVHRLGADWDPALHWYARAVRELQGRPLDDPTSWRFLAAIHGIDKQLWQDHGYLTDSDTPPTRAVQLSLWRQCQHQSWYFLPWHRGYLAAFEAIVRAAITKLGGPSDWALPYWNYNEDAPLARQLPAAFLAPSLADGSPNPLRVKARWGGANKDGTGDLVDPAIASLTAALQDDVFSRPASRTGATTGFGGPETVFNWSGGTNGALEASPHNFVHGMVGGERRIQTTAIPGLMSHPWTAALDPIFWLHHANIDRLWEVWRTRAQHHVEPTAGNWLKGPADRAFEMPSPSGAFQKFNASQMLDTRAPGLDYEYDDITDPLLAMPMRTISRLQKFGLDFSTDRNSFLVTIVDPNAPTELIGANDSAVALAGPDTTTAVRIDRDGSHKLLNSYRRERSAGEAREPDRVFLNLEGVRGHNDAAIFKVYVNLPDNADPAAHPENYAGAFSLFGVDQASRSDSPHGGNGLTQVLEITQVIDDLHLAGGELSNMIVRFVTDSDVQPQDEISVARVSVYRQGE